MPAPLTVQQIALYMSKRRAGSRQEVAAAAAGISVSSAHRIDSGRLQPKAAKPRGRRRPDPLAEVWEPLLLPLLVSRSLRSIAGELGISAMTVSRHEKAALAALREQLA